MPLCRERTGHIPRELIPRNNVGARIGSLDEGAHNSGIDADTYPNGYPWQLCARHVHHPPVCPPLNCNRLSNCWLPPLCASHPPSLPELLSYCVARLLLLRRLPCRRLGFGGYSRHHPVHHHSHELLCHRLAHLLLRRRLACRLLLLLLAFRRFLRRRLLLLLMLYRLALCRLGFRGNSLLLRRRLALRLLGFCSHSRLLLPCLPSQLRCTFDNLSYHSVNGPCSGRRLLRCCLLCSLLLCCLFHRLPSGPLRRSVSHKLSPFLDDCSLFLGCVLGELLKPLRHLLCDSVLLCSLLGRRFVGCRFVGCRCRCRSCLRCSLKFCRRLHCYQLRHHFLHKGFYAFHQHIGIMLRLPGSHGLTQVVRRCLCQVRLRRCLFCRN
mmetsp:Transcript_20488/g.50383  ORF Transcript_20488/g.50383 Transcript_20488/m.50383 type:complete len:380 (-) Transcript_20488:95-1234(-)